MERRGRRGKAWRDEEGWDGYGRLGAGGETLVQVGSVPERHGRIGVDSTRLVRTE